MFGSGTTTLIISNEEMNDNMKIVKSLEESCLLIKGVSETINNEAKEQKREFISMLLGTLGGSLLRNLSTGKGVIATNQGRGTSRADEGTVRVGQDFCSSASPSTNFEISKNYQNELKFNGVYLRNNLPEIKDGYMC